MTATECPSGCCCHSSGSQSPETRASGQKSEVYKQNQKCTIPPNLKNPFIGKTTSYNTEAKRCFTTHDEDIDCFKDSSTLLPSSKLV